MPCHGKGVLRISGIVDLIMTGPAIIERKANANWLLRILVLFSIGIHLILIVHVSGLYRPRALRYIELTLQDITKPIPRSIPRPRNRRRPPPQPPEVKKLEIVQKPIPSIEPMKLEPAQADAPDTLVERMVMPELPVTPFTGMAEWSPPAIEDTSGDFATPASYLEMVKFKIEKHKRYPDEARERKLEGRAKLGFVITTEGEIKDLVVVKSSGHAILDRAAMEAVDKASPLPRPPARLFKGGVFVKITVSFELIWRKTQNDILKRINEDS